MPLSRLAEALKAPVDIRTARHELSLPPKLTYGQIKGFTLYATRTILSGEGEELIELAKTNLHELETELPGPYRGPLITITGLSKTTGQRPWRPARSWGVAAS